MEVKEYMWKFYELMEEACQNLSEDDYKKLLKEIKKGI